ncbi:HNH endonuclease signature motif containing protein [Clostridium sp. 2-1]|uniref:HNH endonuclease n=1 Tax=Clostridium sp. 2-1 TaxID=2070758 RepID=UPI001FA8A143|nr:HNH endonuclease signature motif containing protein [Clostridium sp. 2-1]
MAKKSESLHGSKTRGGFFHAPERRKSRYCEEHAKLEAKRYNRYGRDPESNKRYGRSWAKIRAAYLSAHPLCEVCKAEGRLTPAELVHHRRRLTDGGTNDWSNLQALCQECHSRLHAERGDYF